MKQVVYCSPWRRRKYRQDESSKYPRYPHFHQPLESDFLGTWVRKKFLYPVYEVDLNRILNVQGPARQHKRTVWDIEVIKKGNVGMLKEWQKASAISHWEIMNTVMPFAVWMNY